MHTCMHIQVIRSVLDRYGLEQESTEAYELHFVKMAADAEGKKRPKKGSQDRLVLDATNSPAVVAEWFREDTRG